MAVCGLKRCRLCPKIKRFCFVRLERDGAEGEAPVRVNELSKEEKVEMEEVKVKLLGRGDTGGMPGATGTGL